jgi:hypothetical protein
MKLTAQHLAKADPLLQEALQCAHGDERLRTLMVLGPERHLTSNREPEPHQFPTRAAYRQALIEHRERQLADELADIMHALEELSLTVHGGRMSPTVVVEGAARRILQALKFPGVRHASLDRPIPPMPPRRPRQR